MIMLGIAINLYIYITYYRSAINFTGYSKGGLNGGSDPSYCLVRILNPTLRCYYSACNFPCPVVLCFKFSHLIISTFMCHDLKKSAHPASHL